MVEEGGSSPGSGCAHLMVPLIKSGIEKSIFQAIREKETRQSCRTGFRNVYPIQESFRIDSYFSRGQAVQDSGERGRES